MTDQEWAAGYTKLAVAFSDREMTEARVRARGDVYREHLDDLSGKAWAHAVTEAILGERWFPTIAALREYASTYQPPALPAHRRSPEEIERDRETARKGLEMIKAEMAKRGLVGEPAKEMP